MNRALLFSVLLFCFYPLCGQKIKGYSGDIKKGQTYSEKLATRSKIVHSENISSQAIESSDLQMNLFKAKLAITLNENISEDGVILFETFDYPIGQLPPGWQIAGVQHGWSVNNSSNAGGESPELRLNWNPAINGLSRLVSYPIDIDGHDKLRFNFKQYFSNLPINEGEVLAIDVAFDNPNLWEPLWEVSIGNDNIPAGEYELFINIPENASNMYLGFRFDGWTFYINYWYLDDFIIKTVPDNDLACISLAGNSTPLEGEENIYSVVVQNPGAITQDNYVVKLKHEGNELASIAGTPIAFGETITYHLPWTPNIGETGPTSIYGLVELENDENPDNNQTIPMNVVVQSDDIISVNIGDGTEEMSQPYIFVYNYSLTQTIYYPEEIGLNGGIINGMKYYNTFPGELLDKHIMIWMGETEEEDLTDGWVDPQSLDLVFNGAVDFPAGDNEIYLSLDNDYAYNGGNLVIYSYKMEDDWIAHHNFYNTPDTGNHRTRRAFRDDTPIDPQNPDIEGSTNANFPNISLLFIANLGALEGTVNENDFPLEGATVSVEGTAFSTTTDTTGFFEFPFIVEGIYNIQFSKFGYEDIVLENIEVIKDETTIVFAEMTAVSTVNVSGFVNSSDAPENGLEGALIKLSGYENYETYTDADGFFLLENIFGNNSYNVQVSCDGYEPQYFQLTLEDTDFVLDNIMLIEMALPVLNIVAAETDEGALISWEEPALISEFRYDDGTVQGHLGYQGSLNSIIGAVHFRSTQLYEISWFLTDEGGPHNTVNVWVLGLTDEGKPDRNNIIYTNDNIPNIDNQWITYELSSPVEAYDGFFIGLSFDGFLGLAYDDGIGDPYEFSSGTHFGIFDVSDPSYVFTDIDEYGFPNNCLLRGYGVDYGPVNKTNRYSDNKPPYGPKLHAYQLSTSYNVDSSDYNYNKNGTNDNNNPASIKALEFFNVYRLQSEYENNPEEWVSVAEEIYEWEYLDTDWYSQSSGIYKYAVVAGYTNDITSPPVFSNELAMDMNMAFNVIVSTNSGDSPENAVVTLTNQSENTEHIYTKNVPSSGQVVFPSIWKGTYDLEIILYGFETYEAVGIIINDDNPSVYNAVLIEKITTPYGLIVETEGYQDGEALFSWNNIFGFDLFEDFESGTMPVDWTQIITNANTEGPIPFTWSVNDYSTNNFSPSGEYHAGLWWDESHQNEWLISPVISVGEYFELEFQTTVFLGSSYNDHYYVKISNDGGENWTELWDASLETGGWNHYDFPIIITLHEYSGQDVQIAFHAIDGPENNGLWHVWFIDNISVGQPGKSDTLDLCSFEHISKNQTDNNTIEQVFLSRDGSGLAFTNTKETKNKAFLGFNVYLNDTLLAETNIETEYLFTDLVAGSHTAGVQSVYTTGSSEIVSINFESTGLEAYTVSFDIKDEDGDPVSDAIVSFNGVENNPGDYIYYNIVEGFYDYVVEKAGYYNAEDYVFIDKDLLIAVTLKKDDVQVPEQHYQNVTIYPNPAHYKLIIESSTKISDLTIYSAIGQSVHNATINDFKHVVDVSGLQNGIYFIWTTSIYGQSSSQKVQILN